MSSCIIASFFCILSYFHILPAPGGSRHLGLVFFVATNAAPASLCPFISSSPALLSFCSFSAPELAQLVYHHDVVGTPRLLRRNGRRNSIRRCSGGGPVGVPCWAGCRPLHHGLGEDPLLLEGKLPHVLQSADGQVDTGGENARRGVCCLARALLTAATRSAPGIAAAPRGTEGREPSPSTPRRGTSLRAEKNLRGETRWNQPPLGTHKAGQGAAAPAAAGRRRVAAHVSARTARPARCRQTCRGSPPGRPTQARSASAGARKRRGRRAEAGFGFQGRLGPRGAVVPGARRGANGRHCRASHALQSCFLFPVTEYARYVGWWTGGGGCCRIAGLSLAGCGAGRRAGRA